MKRFSVRPATFADIEAVCSLSATQNIADYGEAMTTTNDWTVIRWVNSIDAESTRKSYRRCKKPDQCTPFVRKYWNEDRSAISYLYKEGIARPWSRMTTSERDVK